MNLKKIYLSFILILTLVAANAQTIVNPSINETYIGGEAKFWRMLKISIKYPQKAKQNGIVCLAVVSFKVNCDNMPGDFKFKNQLGYGFEETIQQSIISTTGQWKTCEDRREEEVFSIKIAFNLDTEVEAEERRLDGDLIVVGYVIGGASVQSTKELENQLAKAMKRGKYEKAKKNLNLLILRNPFKEEYQEKLKKVEEQLK